MCPSLQLKKVASLPVRFPLWSHSKVVLKNYSRFLANGYSVGHHGPFAAKLKKKRNSDLKKSGLQLRYKN
jgi:hypothetical protein